MRKTGVTALAAALAMLGLARPAAACGYGMPSPLARFALAECVVVGKVIALESRSVSAALLPGGKGPRAAFTIAVVKVQEMLKGDDRLTHLRVGLLTHQALRVGHEACFFLNEHEQESFFVQGNDWYDYPINKLGNAGFAAEVERHRRLGKLSRAPVASLRSASAEDRFLSAALLVTAYRTFRPSLHVSPAKTEPVDGRISALILKALAEADWKGRITDFRLTPWRVIGDLGATARDGWNPPSFATMDARETFTRQWLRDHAGQFRLAAYVAAEL